MPAEDFSNIIVRKQYPTMCPDEDALIDLFKTVKHSKQDVNKMLSDAWLGIYANDDTLFNPLNNLPPQAADNFTQYLVWLMSQPDYFYFIIKCLFNMDSFPFQCLLLRELFNHKYPLLIGARGLSKTSTLALYLLISMIIRPNIKIVITGAGFRQAKLVFEEMEKVWQRSPVLRSCFPGRDPITHGTDSWKFRLGGSITHALPTGPDGSKVRGYRANILLCVHGSTIIETDKGFISISEFDNVGATFVRNENGQFEKPELFFKTEPQDVYFLETDTYRTLLCSAHHQIRNGNNEWVKVSSLTIDENVLVTENGVTKIENIKVLTKLPNKEILYDFVMPESHSFIGNGFINHNCDEFASTNRTVFEEVMGGFLSVAANPIEQIHIAAKSDLIKALPSNLTSHITQDEENDPYALSNQLILAGTAYYKHNHFYTYYNKWRQIISSAGDKRLLEEILGEDYDPNTFNWKDYSVIRIPIKLSTKGFMDMSQVSRTKASTSKDVYAREFDCIFTDDSDGFYRRSIIDSCTISDTNIVKKNDEEVRFGAVLYGDPNKKYIYGVDPAYEGDNFAIVILECEKEYRKVVHVWTTQASDHKQLLADKVITENDYYHYAARKIRNLMKRFPCAYIAIDTHGGGRAVIEALSDSSKLEENERMILPYIDPTEPPKDTDSMEGDHIIYEIKPTNDWNVEANHSLKKDMEMKDILFPAHDGISYSMAEFYDNTMGKYSELYDTLEDCIHEIEELKNELTMIVVTETATGKQRFDTPEIKIGISKKGKLKKDRYSALLMANFVARNMDVLIPRRITSDMFGEGGFAKPSVFLTGNSSVGNPSVINQFERLYDSQLSDRPSR